MAFTLIDAIIFGAAGFGISQLSSGMSKSASNPTPAQATLPNQQTQTTAAATTVADQRAALLSSGGITDYTGGMGVLTGTDTSKTTLIGG